MKYFHVLRIAMALAVATPQLVYAQQTTDETTALIGRLKGEVATTQAPTQWQSDYARALETLLPDIGSDDLGKQRAAQQTWERIALHASRPGAEVQRVALVQSMLAHSGPQTSQAGRIWLLKMLEWTGRAEAVPSLVSLLVDNDNEIRERARRALANNPSPEAAQALRDQLKIAATPERRIAFINALAYRRDNASINMLGEYITNSDAAVALQALAALGNIGNSEASKVLSEVKGKVAPALRPILIDTQLRVAGQLTANKRAQDATAIYGALYAPGEKSHIRMAALRGLVQTQGSAALPVLATALSSKDGKWRNAAARLTLQLPSTATKNITALLPKLPAEGQVALLSAIANRGDVAARADVLAMSKSTADDVRIAAWRALGNVGNSADIPILVATAANAAGAEANAARDSLGRLKGASVEVGLQKLLSSNNAKAKTEALRALSARRSSSSLPLFARLTGDADGDVRREAVNALGSVGSITEIPHLLTWMQKTNDDGEIGNGARALINIYLRTPRTADSATPLLQVLAAPNSSPALRAAMLQVSPTVGGDAVLNAIKSLLDDPNPTVQEAAVRAFSDWGDAAAAPDVLNLARTSTNQTYQVLALRGLDRMLRQKGRSNDDKIKLYSEALSIAKRDEEKRLLISGLGEIREPAALTLVQPYLADANLKEDAASSATRIAKDWNADRLKDARPTLEQVVKVTQNNDTKRDAQRALDRAN
jgi:HEAT repeat protein